MNKAIICLLIIINSCTLTHKVYINNDSSAIIETDWGIDTSFVRRVQNSKIISEIDIQETRVKFKLGNIDSLGKYIPYVNPNYLMIWRMGDTIGFTTPLKPHEDFTFLNGVKVVVQIKTEEPMSPINFNVVNKRKSEYEFWLYGNKRKQHKGKNKINPMLIPIQN